ncbi:hypothetical protein IX84_10005 [Phaeodactylibacter xiamenensis]|uniref:Uncharacterized protein n=1 Tax=Phaeodactylibacter xiamenensis TaxID=1524460 RepID=A0A098S936_9BACT|nr:hypothetical protein IX84_10005 [Phaeodactylibacter xiamenensis]
MFEGFAYLLLLTSNSTSSATAPLMHVSLHGMNWQNKSGQTTKAQALSLQYPGFEADAMMDGCSQPFPDT